MNEKLKQALALTLAFFVGYAPVTWAKTQYRFTNDSNVEVATMDDSGNFTATSFSGDGSGLTSVPASLTTGQVTSDKLAADSVDSEKIVDNAVLAEHVGFNYAGSASEGGAATTASALAANGSNCSANQFNKGVDAAGNAESCAALVDADVPNSITVDLAATATALAADPADCSANQYANAIAASGALSCSSLSDADVPNSITIDNLSGTNTGDQTITLTGDVTGSGTGSFAATVAAGAITTGKLGADAVDSSKILNGSVAEVDLAFSPATDGELSSHTGTADAHYVHATTLGELNTDLGSSIADGPHTTDTDTWADLLQLTDTAANICAATPAATPKLALGTDSFDLYSATGTSIGQWRNTRTGAGPC
jgi:hypothetical protein